MKHTTSILITLGALLLATPGQAESTAGSHFRLVTLDRSYHHDKSYEYAEQHTGIGLDIQFENKIWGSIIYMDQNSFGNESWLVTAYKEKELFIDELFFGPMVGVATGYNSPRLVGGLSIRYRILRVVLNGKVDTVGLVLEF